MYSGFNEFAPTANKYSSISSKRLQRHLQNFLYKNIPSWHIHPLLQEIVDQTNNTLDLIIIIIIIIIMDSKTRHAPAVKSCLKTHHTATTGPDVHPLHTVKPDFKENRDHIQGTYTIVRTQSFVDFLINLGTKNYRCYS